MVDDKALMACVYLDLRLEGGQVEMGKAEVLGLALQFAVVVGHAHRADVVALHEEHLDDRAAVLDQRGESVVTFMPSSTLVTQAAKSLFDPATSTTHRRQAPMSEMPSRWQRVGMAMEFSLATSRIV